MVLRLKTDKNHKLTFPFEQVLLISDEEDFIENAKAAFTSTNHVRLSIARSEAEADDILSSQPVDIVLLGSSLGNQKLENHVHRLRENAGKAILLYCCKYEERKQLIGIENNGGVDGIVVRPFFLSTLLNTVDGLAGHGRKSDSAKESVLKGMRFLCAECDIYSNGKELVEAFGRVKAGDYDAVLMDVQMPAIPESCFGYLRRIYVPSGFMRHMDLCQAEKSRLRWRQ